MSISNHQVEAYFFGNPKSIAEKILLIKRNARLDQYREHLTAVHEFGNVWQGVTGLLRGEKITIIVTGVGPSMIGDATYALNKPDSICVYSGTCGGLHQDLEIGDYFIADQTICGDGYTFHFGYQPFAEITGDFRLLESLKARVAARVKRVKHGTAFTTSSVVRETEERFWEGVHRKCSVIEMAAAAFYAAAAATQKRAAAYFWISDLPKHGKSFFETCSPEDIQMKQERFDRSVTLDLELLSSL